MNNNKESDQKLIDSLLVPFEKRGMDLNKGRIISALNAMGSPCSDIPGIHVIGTNGKGSITTFIKSSLIKQGIRVGVTISPHLITWRERISINNENISSQELKDLLTKIKPLSNHFELTTFEFLIAAAFDYFSNKNLEVLILEAGLGGRLDATTAHPNRPIIAIGSIGLDHCDHLGNTLEEITYEKAAAITPNSTVISASQYPAVQNVLEQVSKKQQATFQLVEPLSESWNLGIKGKVQTKNAAVAKVALETLKKQGISVSQANIRHGFCTARIPGRFQYLYWNNLKFIVDGAHNPHAAKELSKERKILSEEKISIFWILGIQAHKDGPGILKELLEPQDNAWIIPIPNHKSWGRDQLQKNCPFISGKLFESQNLEEVFNQIKYDFSWPKNPPIVCGSLYLIGHILTNKIFTE